MPLAETHDLLLDVKDVQKTYMLSAGWFSAGKRLQAVREVSLTLRKGETLGIVGESGCGKSTLAKILLNLVPANAGEISVGGQPVDSISRMDFSRRVQPVFQDPYSTLNPRRTVVETVAQPLAVHKIGDHRSRRVAATDLLDKVGLPKRVHDAFPHQLSGGQRQRVAVARALILKPDLLICDEPTSALDVSIQAQILNLIQDLQRELGIGIVFISHNLAVVEHVADTIAVMYLGRVVESGPAKAVLSDPRHPYTQALLASVLTPEPDLGLPVVDLGTSFPDPTNVPSGCSFHTRCRIATERCRMEAPSKREVARQIVECHLA
ncbi:oligopeptide/dipeptide ABC transporter ATP-binding protein [Mesorhizobium sp. 8]|uniref:ABC transporter ATP-binding protein n=1 Tax=Mesorhizobium sp. 8 TaxID=2584466 RepID=UPI0011243497|nr:oligopeptide/dipeptide ABC transporter ATP-binding protein [Mesorhizobium sp. 8]QDB99472.1 ATP-binding cassette domain-containing protein [Mesorhizobium sp. 8]